MIINNSLLNSENNKIINLNNKEIDSTEFQKLMEQPTFFLIVVPPIVWYFQTVLLVQGQLLHGIFLNYT